MAILLPGCRTARDNQIEILERELRTQEDYIYELEDYVIQYSEKLRSMRCAQAIHIEKEPKSRSSVVKRPKSEGPELHGSGRQDQEQAQEDLPGMQSPDDEPDEEFNLDEYEPPPLKIEEPTGAMHISTTDGLAQFDEQPESSQTEHGEIIIPSPVDYADSELDPEPEASALVKRVVYEEDLFEDQDVAVADYEVASKELDSSDLGVTPFKIVVKQLFRDDESGSPQRLLAVVEGRDRNNEPIEFTGDVSLMVMVGDAQRPFRLKRWDFVPKDVSAAWQSSHLGDGLHLELPLEDTKLPNLPLELWVRLIDGKRNKLLTQKSFSRTQLAGLEVETGAKELQRETAPKIAQKSRSKETSEDTIRSADNGWRSSTQSTAVDAEGFASSLRKAGGWTAQPTGGRYPHSQESTSEKFGENPVWTAGRVKPSSQITR